MAEIADDPGDQQSPQDISNSWQIQLGLADKDQQDWVKCSREIIARYRAEKLNSRSSDTSKRFNILFSNTEVLQAALYGRAAKPDVRRRFADKDPIGRIASEVIERALIFCAESYDVDKPLEKGIHDYLLTGRGVVRVDYEPVIEERPSIDPMTLMPVMDEDGEPAMEKFIAYQELKEKYVYWEDYRQAPARVWDDVWWIAFRRLMTRDDLDGFFSSVPQGSRVFGTAKDVPLNWSPDIDNKRQIKDDLKKAEVWEIWDRDEKQRVWIVKGYDKPLRIDEDPYGLEDFYPLPEPIRSIEDTETQVPIPEFTEYRDQADDLDEITARISRLTRALKRRGVYNQAVRELKRLARAGDNEFIPVENYQSLMDKGGLESQFQTEDLTSIVVVLKELYQQRNMLVQSIYEVTGIGDIMRGATDPNETLGAQQLKAQFGSQRLKKRQRQTQKWIRDLYKLKAEIIAEHYQPDVLQQITGMQIPPEVFDLLKSDKLRSYRIDIETDSTVFQDAQQEKQATIEMITAISGFIGSAMPVVSQQPALMPLAFALLEQGVRALKEGRKIEDVLQQTEEAVSQAMQQPKPDPEQQKMQAQMQMQQDKHQMDMQGKAADVQATQVKAQAEQAKAHADITKAHIQQQTAVVQAMQPKIMAVG